MDGEKKKGYSVKEICGKYGITRKTLFYYDRIHLLSPRQRTVQNYKQYSEEEIIRLGKILDLREAGLTIHEIRILLDGPKDQRIPVLHQALQRLRMQQKTIEDEIRRLNEIIEDKENNQ